MEKIMFENCYSDRTIRIKDYCKDGAKILILYPHGFGDVLMFYPFFKSFKSKYANCKIDLKVDNKFSCLFPDVLNEESYDYVFWIPAYFNEMDTRIQMITKPQCNVLFDLGDEYDSCLEYTESFTRKSNIVGFSFFNSFHPQYINCPYETAKKLWEKVQENGFIAIDLFIPKTKSANKAQNSKYDFVDWSMRTKGIGIEKMISIMCSMAGMASVATGNFHYGMTIYPNKMLYLEKDFPVKRFTNKDVLCLDVMKPDEGVIEEWIRRLQS